MSAPEKPFGQARESPKEIRWRCSCKCYDEQAAIIDDQKLWLFNDNGRHIRTSLMGGSAMHSATELIAAVADFDKQIEDFEVHLRIFMNEELGWDVDWGYDRGKEYWSGDFFGRLTGEAKLHLQQTKWAFDGKKLRSQVNYVEEKPLTVGRIQRLDIESFRSVANVKTLLGTDFRYEGRARLGQALLDCKNIRLREQGEMIDGHLCQVLEAVGGDHMTDGRAFDIVVWIDPARQYRVLKYDKYVSYTGKMQWKELHQRVHDIKLELIDGIWFPIHGQSEFYSRDLKPVAPFKEADYEGLSWDQAVEKGLEVVYGKVHRHTVEVDPATVRINRGVPPERFTIEYPVGAFVADEFTNTQYRVGGEVIC
jgi:hypothetical protein